MDIQVFLGYKSGTKTGKSGGTALFLRLFSRTLKKRLIFMTERDSRQGSLSGNRGSIPLVALGVSHCPVTSYK